MRWVLVALAVVALAVGATLAVVRYQVRTATHVDRFTVTVVSPGLSPEQADEGLGGPLERALRSVGGVSAVRVVSRESLSLATVELEWTLAAPLDAQAELHAAVESMRPQLPDGADVSLHRLPDPSRVRHHRWVVDSDALPLTETSRWVSTVFVREVERLQGVTSVETCGLEQQQVVVTLDPLQLAARGLPPTEVVRTLERRDDTFLIRAQGETKTTLESLESTRFETTGIALRDVATISVLAHASTCTAWQHGRRVIVLDVTTDGPPTSPLTPPAPPAGLRLTMLDEQRSTLFVSPRLDASLAATASENAVVRMTGRDVEVLGAAPTTTGLTLMSGTPPSTRLQWLGPDTLALRARAMKALSVLEAKRPLWRGQPWPGEQVPEKVLRPTLRTWETATLARLMVGGVRVGEVRDGAETREVWVKVAGELEALPLLRLADGSPLDRVMTLEEHTAVDAVLRVNGQRAVEVSVGLPEADVRAALPNDFPEALIDSR